MKTLPSSYHKILSVLIPLVQIDIKRTRKPLGLAVWWNRRRKINHSNRNDISSDAGVSINTPNIGSSALIIEELNWGGQKSLNTCENSLFGPHLGLEGKKTSWANP